jgi:hypothetical protein
MAPGITDEVRSFIMRHIQSVEQLEVLLLLRAAPDKEWTPDDVARALVSQRESAERWLLDLTGRGLLTHTGGFRFAPGATDARVVDGLAEAYAKRRVTVVGLIFSKPSEAVQSFADAFRLRRDP